LLDAGGNRTPPLPAGAAYWWGNGAPFLARRLGRRGAVLGVLRGWLDYRLRRSRLPGSDRLRLRLEDAIDPVQRLRTPGLPAYLIPLASAPDVTPCDRPRWLDEPESGRRLLTPAGLFLPTAYLTLRERDLTAARRATKALAVPR
jgi:hypothetical protein